MLNDIEDVLAALDSEESLADAFEDNGVFADKLSKGLSAGDFWKKSTEKVLLWTGVTDFTRFGVWRKQFSDYANHNDPMMSEGTYQQTGNREAFAYSPLAQTVYVGTGTGTAAERATAARGYPGAVRAVYRGETLAVGATIFYTGTIEARVQWDADDITDGQIRFTISDLTATDPKYGALRHGNLDTVVGDTVTLADGTYDVRDLIFTATITHDSDGKVGFASASGHVATVMYDTLDGTATLGGSITPNMTSTIGGSFVGQDADGPLSMIGTWSITGDVDSDAWRQPYLGVGTERAPLYGSFGAEIAP